MSDLTFRLATPADAESFAKWAAENPETDQADLRAGMKANNPTAVYFVAEKDGIPVMFASCYAAMHLAYLGINPEARGTDRLRALQTLMDGAEAFAYQFGVREIETLTKPEYGVAKWAAAHGFEKDERSLYRYDINKVLETQEK